MYSNMFSMSKSSLFYTSVLYVAKGLITEESIHLLCILSSSVYQYKMFDEVHNSLIMSTHTR